MNRWDEQEFVREWDVTVGNRGDPLQRLFILPYVLAIGKFVCECRELGIVNDYYLEKPLSLKENRERMRSISENYFQIMEQWFNNQKVFSEREIREFVSSEFLDTRIIKKKPYNNILNGLRFVDLGSGNGYMSDFLVGLGASGMAIDASKAMTKRAKTRFRNENIEFKACNIVDWIKDCEEEFDIVLMFNVLQHIDEIHTFLENLSSKTSNWSRKPLIVLSTLNPDFFLSVNSEKNPNATCLNSEISFEYLSNAASTDCSVFLRSWIEYENLFSRSNFHVLDSLRFPGEIISDPTLGNLVEINTNGFSSCPFRFWTLLPGRIGKCLEDRKVKSIFEQSKYKSEIDFETNVERLLAKPREITFNYNERLVYAHNLGTFQYLLTEGFALMIAKGGARQVFDAFKSPFIGELESSPDLFGSRYMYDVYAGSKTCKAIAIPRDIFLDIVNADNDKLGVSLFKELRDRLVQFSWRYHKDGKRGKNLPRNVLKKFGVTGNISTSAIENVAGFLHFSLSVERGFRPEVNVPCLIIDKDSLLEIRSQDFNKIIELFKAAGIVDVYAQKNLIKNPRDVGDSDIHRIFEYNWNKLVNLCVSVFIKRFFDTNQSCITKLDPEKVIEETVSLPIFQYHGTQLFNQNALNPISKRALKEIASIREFFEDCSVPGRLLSDLEHQILVNLAFAQLVVYRAGSEQFLVLNDPLLLRKFCYDRMAISRYFTSVSKLSVSDASPVSFEKRMNAYLRKLYLYFEHTWKHGKYPALTLKEYYNDINWVSKVLRTLNP